MAKNLFWAWFRPVCAQIRTAKCFFFFSFKNMVLSVTRYHGQLLACVISEENNDLIFRKFSDGWTDGQTDERK